MPEDKRRRRTLLAAAEGARALGTGRGGLLGEAAAAGGSIGHGNAMAAGDRHALVASGDEKELKDDADASMVDVFVHRENHHEHGALASPNPSSPSQDHCVVPLERVGWLGVNNWIPRYPRF